MVIKRDATSGLDTVSATLDDGTGAVPVSNGDPVLTAGIYTLAVSASDMAGNQHTVTHSFVIYDPSTGFATGGGWFIPGQGINDDATDDLLPGLDYVSKATFGFVVKYKNGASTAPSGQLQFQYHVGDFKLHSSDYEWLVLTNNNWAKFQGVATLNGSTELYPFKVDAFDADNNGGTQADRFVIKIWDYYADPDVDNPIYKASGDLGGGKVKIHN